MLNFDFTSNSTWFQICSSTLAVTAPRQPRHQFFPTKFTLPFYNVAQITAPKIPIKTTQLVIHSNRFALLSKHDHRSAGMFSSQNTTVFSRFLQQQQNPAFRTGPLVYGGLGQVQARVIRFFLMFCSIITPSPLGTSFPHRFTFVLIAARWTVNSCTEKMFWIFMRVIVNNVIHEYW